jgi:hypothetical protein
MRGFLQRAAPSATHFFLALTATSAVLLASPALADPVGAVSTDGYYAVPFDGYTMGFRFQATQALTIGALGVFDYESNGFAVSHNVGLWNDYGTLLASTTVTSTDYLLDSFRYASITSLTLNAGQFYRVGATAVEADPSAFNGSITTATGIRYTDAAFTPGTSLSMPTTLNNSHGYLGGTVLIGSIPGGAGAVPEPASWAMMVGGFGAIGGALRRRRKAAVSFG